jgi:hypothetical protein
MNVVGLASLNAWSAETTTVSDGCSVKLRSGWVRRREESGVQQDSDVPVHVILGQSHSFHHRSVEGHPKEDVRHRISCSQDALSLYQQIACSELETWGGYHINGSGGQVRACRAVLSLSWTKGKAEEINLRGRCTK